jgi:hypothetical protein
LRGQVDISRSIFEELINGCHPFDLYFLQDVVLTDHSQTIAGMANYVSAEQMSRYGSRPEFRDEKYRKLLFYSFPQASVDTEPL